MDSLRTALTWVKDLLKWLPDPAVALLILAFAVLLALALHRWASRLVRHAFAERYPYVFSFFMQTRGLTRAALLILAMMVAVPVAPLPPETAALLARLMAVAVIGLIGWAAIIALHIAADLYLRRFRLDIDDNLLARKHNTQVRVLARTIDVLLIMLTLSAALMTFPAVRQYGVSLFASAGVAGIVAGLAARPVLSNLMAGVQLAMTQPIRLYDAVIVENEYGIIEEITSTYVVVKLWDLRRMIVPLTYFIEKPFQNWTRENSSLIGNVMLYVDYGAPADLFPAPHHKRSALRYHRFDTLAEALRYAQETVPEDQRDGLLIEADEIRYGSEEIAALYRATVSTFEIARFRSWSEARTVIVCSPAARFGIAMRKVSLPWS